MSVTHSVDEAKVLVDKIALIGLQPGRIVDVIGVNLDRPRWAYDASAENRYVELRSYLSGHMRTGAVGPLLRILRARPRSAPGSLNEFITGSGTPCDAAPDDENGSCNRLLRRLRCKSIRLFASAADAIPLGLSGD